MKRFPHLKFVNLPSITLLNQEVERVHKVRVGIFVTKSSFMEKVVSARKREGAAIRAVGH